MQGPGQGAGFHPSEPGQPSEAVRGSCSTAGDSHWAAASECEGGVEAGCHPSEPGYTSETGRRPSVARGGH